MLRTERSFPFEVDEWPKVGRITLPLGTMPMTAEVEKAAEKRLAAIRRDLAHAGEHYPRDEVLRGLAHWGIPHSA